MSRFIFSIFLLLGTLAVCNAQTIQQVEYASSSTDLLLYKKFKTASPQNLRKVLAEMTLRGEANLQGHTFKKAGRFRDRIEITQRNAEGAVAFQLEILESTFLHFVNTKEAIKQEEEKRNAIQPPLLTFAFD